MNYEKYVKASKFTALFILKQNSERFDYYLRNSENSLFKSTTNSFVIPVILPIFKSKLVNFLFFKS